MASASSGKVYSRKPAAKAAKASKPSPRPPPADASSDDASSSPNRPSVAPPPLANGHARGLAFRSRQEARELRRRLAAELELVRALSKRIEAHELQLASDAGYTRSQLSATDPNSPAAARAPAGPFRRQISVPAAASENKASKGTEKEKRASKTNQYCRDSDSALGKEKSAPGDRHGHKKSKFTAGKKQSSEMLDASGANLVDKKLFVQAFKSCSMLLSKLMKHKHGWVFNVPVDVKALGLHDYHKIIKCPMDLGTVKSRLAKDWYNSPHEFAEDVRLTFKNAMTYNPKGQDVHAMAEQLLHIFDDQWPATEAEFSHLYCPLTTKKKPPPLDLSSLERSGSTVHPVAVEPNMKPVNHPAHIGRMPAPKKPKAKDPNKRDMTFEEKQRLSNNLQNLPPEKLENIVQIIKKRNSSFSQNDDEIEVDIDSVDVETLWELDRFVTNYKKSLSKNKRKAELAILGRQATEHNPPEVPHEMVQEPVVSERPEKKDTAVNERYAASSSPIAGENKEDNATRSSSSSSSGSDSESSSSDSDSESTSACGSDAAHSHSPRT
ncbi:hypothetical protein Cni_G21184 [Canna indica]|uniref:Transcription factor GTE4 n=1 Tax=Canna indica TaxID=4628 RepID=A0AAQ3KP20_9LILI|nr:hypothetical protein Cni_G21184 [Canna indica]